MAIRLLCAWMVAVLACAGSAHAQATRPSLQDSFRIGGGGGALCQAQSRITGPAIVGMFDRSWSIVCRDAATPVGQLFALRHGGPDPIARIENARAEPVDCAPPGATTLADIGAVAVRDCRLRDSKLGYRVLTVDRGDFTYVAQGFAGYASALDLALRSIVTDRIVAGKVDVATLGGADAAAFARMEAQTFDPALLLGEGYRRNHSGNYAEAAQFFDTMQSKLAESKDQTGKTKADNALHEALVNRALQLSNLGEFKQADALFANAAAVPALDPVQARLGRNLLAIHHLNQRDYAGARAILDAPLPAASITPAAAGGEVVITQTVAAAMNGGGAATIAGLVGQETALTPAERMAILDAQALSLRGASLRLDGQPAAARGDLQRALAALIAIRNGRVTSVTRLRAHILGEVALTHEAERDYAAAEASFREALDLLRLQYPETVAMNGARAQLAAFLVRRGRADEALALYREIIVSTTANQADLTGLANQIQPYFALLAERIPTHPELTADLFLASQTLIRPGAAGTLEQLARALASGSDDGARLFRQSLSLSRDIERGRIALAQIEAQPNVDRAQAAAQRRDIATLETQKTASLAALAAYPQYRAVSKATIGLADLQAMLRPGEAYFKLIEVDDALYAVYADATGATGYRLSIDATDLARAVARIRRSISTTVSGVQATYPFDVKDARALYGAIFGPVAARLSGVRHLIFEPDGAMLELPPNLLIADQKGVDAYLAQRDAPGGDDFDFRGIDWLGRDRAISTSLSARSFADARKTPPSTGPQPYIGFGDNAPPSPLIDAAYLRTPAGGLNLDCRWPLSAWDRPISARELRDAAQALHAGAGDVVTGAAFTDQAILGDHDLGQFRIVHFATHGLISAPRPGCPVQPALLTSFGGAQSDGLLSFSEIFNLKLDADLVILSACDTAAGASRAATQAAGLGSGGGNALGGLVRAFIGAGGRSVIASHWPAPDDYNATRRLFTGLFAAPPGTSIAEALRSAEIPLMDAAATSHPFYWSGFAIIGDGARPLVAGR